MSDSRLIEFIQKPVDFAIANNNVGFYITHNGRCLWEALDIHYINIIVDSPIFYSEVIQERAFSKSLFLCIDKEHPEFIERLRPDIPSAFLPHSAWSYDPIAPDKQRETDIIYAISITSHPMVKRNTLGKFLAYSYILNDYLFVKIYY